MPINKTQEELLASKIKPRNYSSVLNTIYFLKKRMFSDYVPAAPNRVVWAATDIGTGSGTSKSFTTLASSSYSKGSAITLAGTATYLLTNNGSTIGPNPAIKIVAQIDVGNTNSGFPPLQVEATAAQINSDGTFSFTIPAEITSKMSVGQHTVYLDASSLYNTTRLVVSGVSDGIQKFIIT